MLFRFAIAAFVPFALSLCPVVSAAEPLQVFILAGQSNMEGHAHQRVLDYMAEDPETVDLLRQMKSPDGTYRKVPHTYVSYLTGENGRINGGNMEVTGQLRVGFGSQGGTPKGQLGEKLGPELAFGITMQSHLKRPILIIKTAWGGQSLHTDFRSPSSGPYPQTESNKNRIDSPEKVAEIKEKTGKRYRQMIEHVRAVLKDPKRVHPEYDPDAGYELAGFVWFQGFNDMVDRATYPNREQPGGYSQYSECLSNLIRDVRADLDAPKLPFVIGMMGVGGPIKEGEEQKRAPHIQFRKAMAAPAALPEFTGTVAAVPTDPYWDQDLAVIDEKRGQLRGKAYALRRKNPNHENADGSLTEEQIRKVLEAFEKELFSPEELALEERAKSNAGYHYLGSAKTYSLIGQAFAEAMLKLMSSKPEA